VDVVIVDAAEHVSETTANHSANNKRTTAPNGSNASCGFACKDNVMKILVTGGAGYVGSHACKALAAKGFEPVAYDNLSRGHRWAVKWGPLEERDIRDEARLGEVLDRHQPVALMHFAALAYVGESVEQPLLYYENNICGSAALFHAIIKTRPSR
jgi:UDP-glucose 4-epimerase